MSVLESVIGWLAPPACEGCGRLGAALCVGCSESLILPFGERCYLCQRLSPGSRTCLSCRPSSPRYVWIATGYDGLPRELLKTYKFHHNRSAATAVAELMAAAVIQANGQKQLAKLDYLVVPVPTATERVRQRGFDHARLLAKKVAEQLNLELAMPLRRYGQANQIGARRAQRLRQQEGVYQINDARKVAGRNVLIIDDVVTTGATLRAVTKVLRRAGAKHVDALVFAKSL